MSTRAATQKRHVKGRPTGGQFAVEGRAEAAGDLLTSEPSAEETVFTRRYDTVDEKIAAFSAELEDISARLVESDEWQSYLDALSKFHRYSASNNLLILMQKPEATRVGGYRVWQSLGRQVRKGERGISILAPRTVRMDVTDNNGKPVLDDKGKPKKAARCVGFTTATVFDVSQTEGDPLPSVDVELSETPPVGFREDLEAAIRATGFEVSYEKTGSAANGFTDPEGKRVVISPDMSPAQQAETLAHELGHIRCGHMDRVGEYHTGHGGARGQMEVEADSFAYTMCRSNGMSTEVGKKVAAYVSGWARATPDPTKAVKDAANNVAKAVKTALGEGQWRNVEPELAA